MKNPLSRRLLRELRQDIGKYIALFLFLTLTTGFISGFLVADGSMVRAYDASLKNTISKAATSSLRISCRTGRERSLKPPGFR